MPARKKSDDDEKDAPDKEPEVPTRTLVRNVVVGGKVYGPGAPQNPVTPEVEAQITNPTAWGE